MNIYGISDLHLSGNPPFKPMTHFGSQYEDYLEKIETGLKSLPSGSILINAGDISWAIDKKEAINDLKWLSGLGPLIVNTIGNHDYWWGNKGANHMNLWLNANGVSNMYFIDHQLLTTIGNITFVATKGSEKFEQLELDLDQMPRSHRQTFVTPKSWDKYVRRLESALLLGPDVLVSHIPPFHYDGTPNEMTEMIKQSTVKMVLYGHRHKCDPTPYDNAIVDGCIWVNLLCERMNFTPKLLIQDDKFVTP